MTFRNALAILAGTLAIAMVPPASAQTVDTGPFNAACMQADMFLLGDVPEGTDSSIVLTPLCGCLVTAFGGFSQADLDMLASDLSGTATEETHAAYPTYADLEERARTGLNTCYESADVKAAMASVTPPEAPAADAPAADAPAAQ